MLIPPAHFDLIPIATRSRPRVSVRRVAGIALSLILHLALLIYLTLPVPRYPLASARESDRPTMNLVLLETQPVAPASVQRLNTEVVTATPRPARRSRQTLAVFIEPLQDPAPVTQPAMRGAEVAAQQLFNDIEAAAAETVATDPRLPDAGMPSALGRVPGRAEPFVHLPLVHREGGGLSRALSALSRHMIIGELDNNPLRSTANRAARRGAEPVCNDPENPLADERCWLPPEQ